jgi:hypothetical protein
MAFIFEDKETVQEGEVECSKQELDSGNIDKKWAVPNLF